MLWVDKYHPEIESDIVVHPKKVAEIKAWLASHYQQPPSSSFSTATNNNTTTNSKVLLLKGPVGAGKSSTIRVLAAQHGCYITEWKAPQTASWEEAQYQHQHQEQQSSSREGGSSLPFHRMYYSAVDSFEEFTIRCRIPALTLTRAAGGGGGGGSRKKNQEEDDVIIIDEDTKDERKVFDLTNNSGEMLKTSNKNNNKSSSLRRLIMIEELPFTATAQQRHRVAEALASLCRSARFPIVLCCSEATGRETQANEGQGGGGNANNRSSSEAWHSTSLLKQVEDSLDPSSYSTTSLNPLTDNMISKALNRVLMRESLDDVVSGARVRAVAEGAGGDVRSALSTMQFLCTGVASVVVVVPSGGNEVSDDGGGRGKKRKKKKKKTAAAGMGRKKKGGREEAPPTVEEIAAAAAPFAQRDGNLTIFHALGRFLYNKRVSAAAAAAAAELRGGGSSGGTQQLLTPSKQKSVQHKWLTTELSTIINPNNALISSEYQRNPTEFDPEAVLTGAGLNASTVSSFLHENYINFIDDAAIEDAAGCCDYLSISDTLASNSNSSGGGGQLVQDDEVGKSTTLSDAAAALTAAMGTCFSNCNPAPRRFLPLKAPASNLVRKAMGLNSKLLQGEVHVQWALQSKSGCLESRTVLASELIPSARLLVPRRAAGGGGGGAPGSSSLDVSRLVPRYWCRVWNGQLYEDAPTITNNNSGNGNGIVLQGEEGEMDIRGDDEEHGSDGGSSLIEDDSESDW